MSFPKIPGHTKRVAWGWTAVIGVSIAGWYFTKKEIDSRRFARMKNSRNTPMGQEQGGGAKVKPHNPSTDTPSPDAAPARTTLTTSTIGGGSDPGSISRPTGVDTSKQWSGEYR